MCSTAAQRLAEIGQAIDDLAIKAGPAAGDADPIVARLAELWALLADLDPEVRRRLAGYQNLSALTDLWPAYRSGRQTGPSLRPLSAGTARPGSTPRAA